MKRDILGVMIDDLDRAHLTREITSRLAQKKRTVIYTPNPVMTQNAKKDKEFMEILNSSDYNIPDGNGMILASRLLKTPIPERICGIELGEKLLEFAALQGLNVFFYGGEKGVAIKAAQKMCSKYSGLKICGVLHGFHTDSARVLRKIAQSNADLIYVCLGSPKQEKWIFENAHRLPRAILLIGLGGSFDVWAGKVTRAPAKVQKAGLEWLWRMTSAPKKFKDMPKLLSFGAPAMMKGLSNVVIMHR